MASPQWKVYQAPVQDPAILAFQRSANTNSNFICGPTMQNAGSNNANNGASESGLIEKLLHSYGFIQCCDREARLFFHFSEFNENIETLKIGDMVQFMMSIDRRTGKPIAVSVAKPQPAGTTNEARITGTVLIEAKPAKNKVNGGSGSQGGLGQVSYEESGEFFFLPFAAEDVETSIRLKVGDQVNFAISRDKRNGNICAIRLRPLQSLTTQQPPPPPQVQQQNQQEQQQQQQQPAPVPQSKPRQLQQQLSSPETAGRYEGVVCSMKESFGFIERADIVKEIFFHYSEYQGNINELLLGDDIEFGIQTRNGKEVAVNIISLPEGTVIFEDIAVERRRGRIQKTLKGPHGRRQSDPLAGRIVYETVKGPIEIPFGDKDQKGDYTLQPEDLIEFNIATDRRDRLQRATNIVLVEDTFIVNCEQREKGLIVTLKDGFGFIRCSDREARMFFHFSEMMDPDMEPQVQDEVEFTIIQDPTDRSRQIAIRIKSLPKGSVSFESVLQQKCYGTVEKEPLIYKSPGKNKEPDPGILKYDVNSTPQMIPYSARVIQGPAPKYGDKVEFQICESRKNNTKTAANVRLVNRNTTTRQQGFIATLKDSFGFIETADHDREVFFHFSNVEGNPEELEIADEVEFSFSKKTSKVSAESIRCLPRGSVAPEEVLPGVLDGRILQSMRIINPDQDQYAGIVQVGVEEDPEAETYPYGITSLMDKKDFLQRGDVVKFQIAIVKSNGKRRASNIEVVRNFVTSTVDSVKGQFGFLNYETEEGKKLFFHVTEVQSAAELQPGDSVQFVVVHNQRNGKYSACSIRKIIRENPRPQRLISRLKSVSEDGGPKLIVLRQPLGPNGRGFTARRTLWKPPVN